MDEGKTQELRNMVERSKAGNQEAFHALYDVLADRLFGYIRSRVRSGDDATDILQDVIVDLWQALGRLEYRSEGHFYAFVFVITKRRLARHYDNRTNTTSLDDLTPSEHPSVEAELVDPDGMRAHVAKLPEKYRDVMVLRYWSGLGFAEIAHMLKTNENTVKVRHHRALEQLRALMELYE